MESKWSQVGTKIASKIDFNIKKAKICPKTSSKKNDDIRKIQFVDNKISSTQTIIDAAFAELTDEAAEGSVDAKIHDCGGAGAAGPAPPARRATRVAFCGHPAATAVTLEK